MYFLVIFSLVDDFVSIAMRELPSCELTTVENSIWMFGKQFLISFVVFLIESPLDVALICRFCRLGPAARHPESFLGVVRANICSRVLSQLNAEEAEGRRTICGKFGICFIVRRAGAEVNAAPAHKLP